MRDRIKLRCLTGFLTLETCGEKSYLTIYLFMNGIQIIIIMEKHFWLKALSSSICGFVL